MYVDAIQFTVVIVGIKYGIRCADSTVEEKLGIVQISGLMSRRTGNRSPRAGTLRTAELKTTYATFRSDATASSPRSAAISSLPRCFLRSVSALIDGNAYGATRSPLVPASRRSSPPSDRGTSRSGSAVRSRQARGLKRHGFVSLGVPLEKLRRQGAEEGLIQTKRLLPAVRRQDRLAAYSTPNLLLDRLCAGITDQLFRSIARARSPMSRGFLRGSPRIRHRTNRTARSSATRV